MFTPRTRTLLVAGLTIFTMSGPASAASAVRTAPHPSVRPAAEELRSRMLVLVNRSRDLRGLPVLHVNARLSREALRHSRHMAETGRISHTPNLEHFVHEVGGTVFGEDVGRGPELMSIRDAWLRQPGTRGIMLDPRFHHVGLGVVRVEGLYWVTLQAFD